VSVEIVEILFTTSFWAAAIRIATPLIFGVLGALICERTGVLNLGIEGIFVAGAMAGWMAVWLGLPLWGGVLVAAARRRAVRPPPFRPHRAARPVPARLRPRHHAARHQRVLLHLSHRPARRHLAAAHRAVPAARRAVLSDIPFLGPVLFQQTALTWLAFAMVGFVAWVLYRTPLGLALRAVGDNPDSVDAQGLSVYGLRIGAVVAGSALMALGGAFLTMSAFDAFFFNMVAGRGWICIALVVFASWRPGKALLGALLFGAFDAFQVRLQIEVGTFLPSQVFLMLPYFLSIAALVMVARKADYPRALLVPWFKGQR
jgi:general nucleoside transport system permease protein